MMMTSVPLLTPGAVGVKVTVIMQLAPTFTPLPQVFVSEKSPVVLMERVIGALPVLLRVSVCPPLVVPGFWLLKVRLPLETWVEILMPVPLRVTVSAVLAAEVVTDNVPVRAPIAVGVKATLNRQDALAAKEAGQLSVSEKSPPMLFAEILTAALPEFTKLTVCIALVIPNC
jgi:hypothetical protein